jgi:hypothetical protein
MSHSKLKSSVTTGISGHGFAGGQAGTVTWSLKLLNRHRPRPKAGGFGDQGFWTTCTVTLFTSYC